MKHNLGFTFNYKNWTKTDITKFFKDVEVGIHNLHNKDKRKDFPVTNLTNQVTVKSTKATTTRDQIDRAEQKLIDLQEKYNQEDEVSDDQSEVDHNRDESDDEWLLDPDTAKTVNCEGNRKVLKEGGGGRPKYLREMATERY